MAINCINNVNNDVEVIDLTSNEDIQVTTPKHAFDNLFNEDSPNRVTEGTVTALVDKHPETYEDLNNQLVRLFECPVCFEHIFPPIFQCLIGHLICNKCTLQCESCPSCRNPFSSNNNLFMEKVGFLIKFPCTNKTYGCKEQLYLNQKLIHESQCYFISFQCFFINCQWQGMYFEMKKHMNNIHSSHILKGSRQLFDILLDKYYAPNNWFLINHNEFFAITFHSNRYLQIQVNFIGPIDKSKQFKFSITLIQHIAQNVSKKLVYQKPILPYTQIKEISYHNGLIENVFSLPCEVIEPFIRKNPRRLPIILRVHTVSS